MESRWTRAWRSGFGAIASWSKEAGPNIVDLAQGRHDFAVYASHAVNDAWKL